MIVKDLSSSFCPCPKTGPKIEIKKTTKEPNKKAKKKREGKKKNR